MGTLDYIVIALFAIAMIGIVVWVFKQKLDFCLEYRFRALDRFSRCRCFEWNGYGTLGNSGLDDPDSRLGVRAFLFQKYGAYDARIP